MIDMIDIVMAKIELTKPKLVCQPVGSHVRGVPAACPTNGLNVDATKKSMTMTMTMKFANANANINVSTTMTTSNAANVHVTRRVHRSWEEKGPKAAPA